MSNIFGTNAPLYWNAGLPAIPLIKDTKRPAVAGWQVFSDRMPTSEEKEAWLRVYGDGNIGLPMGPASGLVAVDIDTEDPEATRIINSLLPPTPWRRVGKKGEVRIYRYNGERTTRIQTKDSMICEVLSKGTQIVLPPSIHPETKAAYRANANLYEILDQVPCLIPGTDDMLRAALIEAGLEVGTSSSFKVTNFVPAGQRDNSMTWHAGILARAVTRGERTLLEALGEMQEWVKSYIEQVVGDPLTVEKAQQKVIYFVVRDVAGARKLALPVGWDEGLTDEDKVKLGLTFNEEDEQWTGRRILGQLIKDLQTFIDPRSEEHANAVKAALERLSRSEGSVSALDEERILRFIVSQSAGIFSLSSLRKGLRDLSRGEIDGENHDEIAREVQKHVSEFGELRHFAGKFWQWKGSHWEEKPEHEIIKVISNEYGHFPSCRKSSDYYGILKLMRSTMEKPLRVNSRRGVNFANGYLDEDLVLREPHPDYGCTYVLPYRYLPEEARNMPLFNQFMLDSWGHDPDFGDKVSAFQEAVGATLFSVAPTYQRAICLIGTAGSGKSVASQIVRALLPRSSVSAVPPEQWSDKFLPAEMFGKVLNFAGELSESRKIPGEIFKQVVEGEQITAQYKNKNPFMFKPACAQWFNSNHLPKTSDTSNGFNRRWLFIEWTRVVPKEKRIPDLASKIADMEREAIAAWAVQGFARLKRQADYTLPVSHHEMAKRMSEKNNLVEAFLADCPTITVGLDKTEVVTSLREIFEEFRMYCIDTGVIRRWDLNKFKGAMRELQNNFGFRIVELVTSGSLKEVCAEGIAVIGYKTPLG